MLYKTVGIILRTRDYGETHKLVTIMTEELGKLTAISRGANRPKSRLSSVSQPFIEGEFLLYVPRGLATLRQGEILSTYRNLRADLTRTAYAAYIAELTDKLLPEKTPDPFLYGELKRTLDWINNEEVFEIPVMMYEMKLFEKGGFAPIVDYCVNCQAMQGPYVFSIQEGGSLCSRCASIDEYAIKLEQPLFRILSIFQQVALARVGNIKVKQENIKLLRRLFDQYYDKYGGFTLKSKKFLMEIDKLND